MSIAAHRAALFALGFFALGAFARAGRSEAPASSPAVPRPPLNASFSLKDGIDPFEQPSPESPPVEVLVVTTKALAPAFAPLLAWKNRTGHPSALRTVEWIEGRYPHGVDLAERVRLCLRDAYNYWGTRTAILGADPDLLPMRFARSYSFNLPAGVDIATDFYYACLEGNWNADGDAHYGEAFLPPVSRQSDGADLFPELQIGRIPARSAEDIVAYLQKYATYARHPDLSDGYLNSFLTMGEVIFDADWQIGDPDSCGSGVPHPCASFDGAEACFVLIDTVQASPFHDAFQFDQLYERDYWWNMPHHRRWPAEWPDARPLNLANVLGSVDGGRNILFHMGHGDVDRWAIGPDRLLPSDVRGLNNSARPSGLVYAPTSNAADMTRDCIASAWLLAPQGGSLDYVGSTNLEFPAVESLFQADFFHRLLQDDETTPGKAYFRAIAQIAEQIGDSESARRFMVFAMTFLGDPDLLLWKSIPSALAVSAPPNVSLGDATVPVTVLMSGSPLAGARVCLYKEHDAMAVAVTDASGVAHVPFQPADPGTFSLTVTHPRAVPFEGVGRVVPSPGEAYLSLESYQIIDDGTGGTRGNGDGRIEVGETVAFSLVYRNTGASGAVDLSGQLELSAPMAELSVTVLEDRIALEDLPAGAGGGHAPSFLLKVSEGIPPDPDQSGFVDLPLQILWRWTSEAGMARESEEDLVPEAIRPHLLLVHSDVREGNGPGTAPPDSSSVIGKTYSLVVDLYNSGGGTWSFLRGSLEAVVPGTADCVDSIAFFPPIPPGESAPSETLRFVRLTDGPLRLLFHLEDTTDGIRDLWTRTLRPNLRPPMPDSLKAAGDFSSIDLTWEFYSQNSHVWGYRVYRSDLPEGRFLPVEPGFVEGVRILTDLGLPPLRPFYYRVAAVDSSGMEGPATDPVRGCTAPPTLSGWPNTLGESQDACPVVENLDGVGAREALFASNTLYAFHAGGDEYVDGDEDPGTNGVLIREADGVNFYGKCALADLNGDGQTEIIAVASIGQNGQWQPPAQLVVFDHLGGMLWAATLINRPVAASPAIGEIDGDSDKEIVFLAGKWVFAFNHDGSPVAGMPGGKLLLIPGGDSVPPRVDWQYGSVALADVDADVRDEIIFTTSTTDFDYARLYVINGVDEDGEVGTNVPGFPFVFSDLVSGQTSTSSPAVGDLTSKLPDGSAGPPDGRPDIVVATAAHLWVFDPFAAAAEKLVWHRLLWTRPQENPLASSPALGDVNQDGAADVAVGGGNGQLYLLDGHGDPLPGFSESPDQPYRQIGGVYTRMGSPILANVDAEPHPEILIGDSAGRLYALCWDGSMALGFPYLLSAGQAYHGLVAADIDGDGYQNLVIQPNHSPEVTVLGFPNSPVDESDPIALARSNPWPQFRQNLRNTGELAVNPRSEATGTPAAQWPQMGLPSCFAGNPYRPGDPITLWLPRPARVALEAFDVTGRRVWELSPGEMPAGRHLISWDGLAGRGTVPSGSYYLRARIGTETIRKSVLLLR